MAEDRKPIPAPTQDPIADAIDRVEARRHHRSVASIPVLSQPHEWPLDADVTLDAGDDPGREPLLLIWEPGEGAYRVIVLPAGTRWRIQQARPDLWQPGRPS